MTHVPQSTLHYFLDQTYPLQLIIQAITNHVQIFLPLRHQNLQDLHFPKYFIHHPHIHFHS